MRVVYDYGTGIGGRNRFTPRSDLPGAGATGRAAQAGRRGETVIIISKEAKDGAAARGQSFSDGGRVEAGPAVASPGERELTPASKELLRAHSRGVRLHEEAHLAVLGGYASSGALYTENRASDGTSYITGGRVKVDLTPVPGDPRATLRKARTIQRAAAAPGDSSPTDMATAAKAYRLQMEAMQEIRTEESKE